MLVDEVVDIKLFVGIGFVPEHGEIIGMELKHIIWSEHVVEEI